MGLGCIQGMYGMRYNGAPITERIAQMLTDRRNSTCLEYKLDLLWTL